MKLSKKEQVKLKNNYGSWSLITGASSGIGLAIAEELAACGLNLIITSRNEEELDRLATRWRDKYKIEVAVFQADLSQTKDVKSLIAECENYHVGLLVAAAGFGSSGPFVNTDIRAQINMLRLNCEAVLILLHKFATRFKSNKRGGIILFSSLVAFQGSPFAANYAATKAYVQSLAEGVGQELKSYGVDMLSTAPGPVETSFGERASMDMGKAMQPDEIAISTLKALGQKSTVFPGKLSKFLHFSIVLLPRWAKIKLMGKIMGEMTKQNVI